MTGHENTGARRLIPFNIRTPNLKNISLPCLSGKSKPAAPASLHDVS
jgi:hypothetical protein